MTTQGKHGPETNRELWRIYRESTLTRDEFARWLGIPRATLDNYLRPRTNAAHRRCPQPIVELAQVRRELEQIRPPGKA